MKKHYDTDVLIIGSGAAGLGLALRLKDHCRVALLAKDTVQECSTLYAQGGVAVVMSDEDSIESHIADTIDAGAGLCNPKVVRFAVERGPKAVQWLINQGAHFTTEKDNAKYHLTREGGHTHRRVLHAADATGHELEVTLADIATASPNIKIYERFIAVDLIKKYNRCVGAYVYDEKHKRVVTFSAKIVVLATGGASRVYLYSSNPDVSIGDGIAMAWRLGATIANMEFNQFHPTVLHHPPAKGGSFLISEALRGEGALLKLPNGERFMPEYDKRAELAPRDIVARAIDDIIKRHGLPHVLLDISHKPASFIKKHFPTIYNKCLAYGFDITKEPIPVVPAAHYTCGGVKIDLNGKTDIPNLYAIGEVTCSGLHGANRMASNSLLECLVFAESASEEIINNLANIKLINEIKPWDESWVKDSSDEVFVSHNWDEIRKFMWDYVGIVRSNKRLERAEHRIKILKKEIQEYYGNFRIDRNLIELRNLIVVADLIVRSAKQRRESRGLHYTLDYPQKLKTKPKNTSLKNK
ncbi:MAG: L-aspartate oxidase [Gammaproteobacteria bacterium]|nr:L-aspartate oxidase [Gammaproteobacteria bacterium]